MVALAPDGIKSIILNTVLLVLTAVFLSLRLIRKRNAFGLDDWLLCIAMLLLILGDISEFLMFTKGGGGYSIRTLNPAQQSLYFEMQYFSELAYNILLPTIKFSILVSYYKIFARFRWFRFALYGTGAFEALWFMGVFPTILFQCTPIKKAWKSSEPGHCIDLVPFLWAIAISNTVLDYTILLLPILPVSRLQMSMGQKLLVLASFSLGSVASIASTMRAIRTNTIDKNDLTETIFQDGMWMTTERHCGIISACLPFLAKYFGQGLLNILMTLSSFVSKPATLLSKHFESNSAKRDEIPAMPSAPSTPYELHDIHTVDRKGFPLMSERSSDESIKQLV